MREQTHHPTYIHGAEQSTTILKKIKKNVRDIFNIAAMHYSNAGEEGIIHFNYLLNCIITDVNNASLGELNLDLDPIQGSQQGKDKPQGL